MTDNVEEKKISRFRSWFNKWFKIFKQEPQNQEQLMQELRAAEQRHILSEEMLGMIERILQVADMQVREVMVPKAQMIVVAIESTLEDVLPIVIESGHSRFPVVDQIGDIVGMLLAKDLLRYSCYRENEQTQLFDITQVMRKAVFTTQSKRLDILLREFRVNRNHIAFVLDEYGHVAGLVTIEDVLEQIVGEIDDEYDYEEDDIYIKKHAEDKFIVKAQTPIAEFNQYFNSDFCDQEFDTIGGIVLQHFGHLPKRGEHVKLKHFRFKVLHSDNRRIYLLEVKLMKKKDEELS